jgi:hypothetical protein
MARLQPVKIELQIVSRPLKPGLHPSTFTHLRTGSFENSLFAFGEALDALRRDFIENRIDFFAQKFISRQIFFHHPFIPAPAGFLGMDFDQPSNRSTGAAIELRPLKMPMYRILNENEPRQNAPKVSDIGHMRAKGASVR